MKIPARFYKTYAAPDQGKSIREMSIKRFIHPVAASAAGKIAEKLVSDRKPFSYIGNPAYGAEMLLFFGQRISQQMAAALCAENSARFGDHKQHTVI